MDSFTVAWLLSPKTIRSRNYLPSARSFSTFVCLPDLPVSISQRWLSNNDWVKYSRPGQRKSIWIFAYRYLDVRDIARIHVAALTSAPEASVGRKRLVVSSPYHNDYKSIIELIEAKRPEIANRVIDPNKAPKYSPMITDLKRVEEVTGIKTDSYISLEDTYLDTVDSLLVQENIWRAKGFDISIPDAWCLHSRYFSNGFYHGGYNFQVFRFLQRISRSANLIWFYFLSFLCWYCDWNEGGWRHGMFLFILARTVLPFSGNIIVYFVILLHVIDPQTVFLSKFYL